MNSCCDSEKIIKSVHIYRSYRQNRPGGLFFGTPGRLILWSLIVTVSLTNSISRYYLLFPKNSRGDVTRPRPLGLGSHLVNTNLIQPTVVQNMTTVASISQAAVVIYCANFANSSFSLFSDSLHHRD